MTRKFLCFFSTVFICFLCFTTSAQGTVTRSFTSTSTTPQGLASSVGQPFNQHVPSVSEGLLQGYTTVSYDTLLLLQEEMGSYTPGVNEVDTLTPEGYDETIYRYVYQMTCQGDVVHTMTQPGVPTYSVTLSEPEILPVGSVFPYGPVTLLLDRSNPYDYPVGVTTEAVWTASVAAQDKECRPKVTIHHFDCPTNYPLVYDYDGNLYPVVNLGYYCWTAKNMRTRHYTDGSVVANVMTYPSQYAPAGTDVEETFGNLYTWDAATGYNISGTQMQGVCPNGWHVPTRTETEYLLANFDAKQLMSADTQIRWIPQNGTDDYGFAFFPAGYYNPGLNRYESMYVRAYFWTTETEGSTIAYACEFGSACGTIAIVPAERSSGFSVRCVSNY